ncbi:amine sulfotransferase-like isoform X1 [Nerophis lumbriciformis]|uniref:amine sulfotransferase-like isoform X1 n=1 Tax=Nerophis lumbriciformis TaxID=546530 RepID=UPI002AE0233A|nr:amine sulfotransferase-like isoform X1 [Nerophis lumbriciformis]XP_061839103.1 amine sulfotransferase-like isoform X1 [Nerophis lumbriciformis]
MDQKPELVTHKGFKFILGTHDPNDVDSICQLETRDSDVFVVTYPKSGTIWMQQILLLLEAKGDVTAIGAAKSSSNADLVPWIEVIGSRQAFMTAPSPRLRVSHLAYHFMPRALRQKTGKVIYVARNPKDVLVSYYFFHKLANMLETPASFEDFFDKFLKGDVFGSSWFEHVKTWYFHKDDVNMLFITYEEMIQDLKWTVKRISLFVGQDLREEQLANVVKFSTFSNMRKIPQASYEQVPDDMFNHHMGSFMRKGTVGDWKNHFTVAQNEIFDKVFQREMKDFPVSFIWDTL